MLKDALAALAAKKDLTADEAASAMGEIMDGSATPAPRSSPRCD